MVGLVGPDRLASGGCHGVREGGLGTGPSGVLTGGLRGVDHEIPEGEQGQTIEEEAQGVGAELGD